jgi:hypothetical protein
MTTNWIEPLKSTKIPWLFAIGVNTFMCSISENDQKCFINLKKMIFNQELLFNVRDEPCRLIEEKECPMPVLRIIILTILSICGRSITVCCCCAIHGMLGVKMKVKLCNLYHMLSQYPCKKCFPQWTRMLS